MIKFKFLFVGYCVILYFFCMISSPGPLSIVKVQDALSANDSQSSEDGLRLLTGDNPILATNISSIITPWNTGNDMENRVLSLIK